MKINAQFTGTVAEFGKLITEIDSDPATKGLLVLTCDKNGFTPEQLNPVLTHVQNPVFGAVFPDIIFNNQKYETGTVVLQLTHSPEIHIVRNLANKNLDFYEILENLDFNFDGNKTIFTFVDGMAERIGNIIEALFATVGLQHNYIGGGAGSLSFKPKPCIITNQGLLGDSLLLALTEVRSGIGISHGWKHKSGPYRVTESSGNRIISLDWKPAMQVYREVVEENTGTVLNRDNFFDSAKSYPFGISKLNAEHVVRDPITFLDDNSIVCVGDVPQESFIDILSSSPDSLISAAGQAYSSASSNFNGRPDDELVFFVDCISRVLYLEDRFGEELSAVHKSGVPMIGALTLGEIANDGGDFLEFFNKTSVVAVMDNI